MFESEVFLGINFEISVKVEVKAVFVGKFVGKFVGERWGSGGAVAVLWWMGWPGSRCGGGWSGLGRGAVVDWVVNLGWSRRVIASEHLFDIWLFTGGRLGELFTP